MFEKINISFVKLVLLGILLSLIVAIFLLAMVPPVSKDALVHHLALPKLYLKHGGMYEIPFMPFSYYPMNLDLLYMIPLYFGNDIAPKFIHFGFALLTAWLIFRYLRRRINTAYALLGVIFFLSVPIIVKLSITVYVDLGVIFFSTASLLLLLKWIENRFQVKFLVLSAIACGLAMGTKYNGLVTFVLLALFVPFLYSRYRKDGRPYFFKPVGYGMLFILIALLIYSPWMIRNYYWKSNPVYPLYNKWFNPPKPLLKDGPSKKTKKVSNKGFFTYRSLVYNETGLQIALLPVRIFFQGKDGSPQYFDGKLNPFLLLLPILAFYRMRDGPRELNTEKKVMLAFAVFFIGFALFSSVMRIRYISPIIPPLIILSVLGLKNGMEVVGGLPAQTSRHLASVAVFLILGVCFIFNAQYIITQFNYVVPFSYLQGKVSRDGYIEKYVPEYPCTQYINKGLPPDAKILFIFLGKRGYYCDREYVLGGSSLKKLFRDPDSPEEVLSKLKRMEITHLFINYGIFEKWVKNNVSNIKQDILKSFFEKYVEVLFHKQGHWVCRLEFI